MPISSIDRGKLSGTGLAEIHNKEFLDLMDSVIAAVNVSQDNVVTMEIKPEFLSNGSAKTSIPIPDVLAVYLAGASLSAYALPGLAGTITFAVKRSSDDADMLEAVYGYASATIKISNPFVLQTTDVTKRNLAAGDACYLDVVSDNAGDTALPVDMRVALTFAAGALA